MRDPAATKAEIEAAIDGACEEFGWLKGRGWFPKKLPFDNQLRYEALDLIKRLPDEVMPPHLRDYICGALSKTRGLRRTYAAGRDGHIAVAVYGATRRGFPPTRNEATRRPVREAPQADGGMGEVLWRAEGMSHAKKRCSTC